MNSVILLILITFEACIYSKYLLVEISVGQIKDDNSKEHERNQFLHHPNKDAFPHSILTLKGLERDEQPITSKGLSGDLGVCNKCGKSGEYKEYFQIQCTNFDQYMKCQSKCVSSEAKSPFDCIKNSTCSKKCESRCKKFWPEAISYDAYSSMIDYIQQSEQWNPYEEGKEIVKWIATYQSLKIQEGNRRNSYFNNSIQSHTLSRAGTPAINFAFLENDEFDKNAPIWHITFDELNEAYKSAAMKRFLPWDTDKTQEGKNCLPFHKILNKRGNFPRRITWLYINNGCHHRAHLFSSYLIKHLKKKYSGKIFYPPKKHFIFGNLHYETKNAENGKDVNWMYHVAPALKISEKAALYILDPSISSIPLTKSEYHEIFRGMITGYVTCESDTYDHQDDCFNPEKASDEESLSVYNELYLNSEWDLQVQLGRDPKVVLGDRYKEDNHYEFKD